MVSYIDNPEYSNYIALSRYSRWDDNKKRRETWEEVVERWATYWENKLPVMKDTIRGELQPAIVNMEVMPSMRSLMTAGPALERDEVAGYNCAYTAIDSIRAFDEILYVLMCGTGVGFSVERKYVKNLPVIAEEFQDTDSCITFSDSKMGWAVGFRELLSMLQAGRVPKLDYSKVRPAGARLKTFGGRASGPEPLKDLCNFSIQMFKNARGRKLNSFEAHELVCKIAEIVVVGGVRRSALISLSDLEDDKMRSAKSGSWWEAHPHLALANNSALYEEKPTVGQFFNEWTALYESKSGERGIFSREATNSLIPKRRKELGYTEFGTNP